MGAPATLGAMQGSGGAVNGQERRGRPAAAVMFMAAPADNTHRERERGIRERKEKWAREEGKENGARRGWPGDGSGAAARRWLGAGDGRGKGKGGARRRGSSGSDARKEEAAAGWLVRYETTWTEGCKELHGRRRALLSRGRWQRRRSPDDEAR